LLAKISLNEYFGCIAFWPVAFVFRDVCLFAPYKLQFNSNLHWILLTQVGTGSSLRGINA